MRSWQDCKNILCIRADNMGDVIMSYPAIRALKTSFQCTVTLLTSTMGSYIVPCLPAIDEVMVYTLPWVKSASALSAESCLALVNELRNRNFDGAVIFTAYSQSALPAAMLAFLAGIPLRLAYSRENAYELLTDWVPDKEPYSQILHQVQRDLLLVKATGAAIENDKLEIAIGQPTIHTAFSKLHEKGIDINEWWIVVHTGVSEKKREYPLEQWIEIVRLLRENLDVRVVLTGSAQEKEQACRIREAVGEKVFVLAGELTVPEFAAVIQSAQLVITVNTATAHIAAATQTPLVVLYAMTNPQHTPWKTCAKVLPFSIEEQWQSKNEVIRFVSNSLYRHHTPVPAPHEVLQAARELMAGYFNTDIIRKHEMASAKNSH